MTQDNSTAQLVERLRSLLAKATPGPWYHYDEIFRPMFGKRRITEIQRDKDGQTLIRWAGFDGLDGSANRKRNANARLIVEAVNALPELLYLIEALARPQPSTGLDMGALSGSRPTDEAASSTASSPSGFDPARDDSVLLIADKDKPLAYLELDDETLGRFARYHLLETNKAAGRDAVGRDMPLVVSLAMHAKVALAHLYTATMGDSDHVWEMHLQGLSWKGCPNAGNWRITVQPLPAIATEAGTAETPQSGSVHEGAGGEAVSPETHQGGSTK